jgi:hypothetical protein
MGNGLHHYSTHELIAQKNKRFAAGDAIQEMVELQKEFKIFSKDHELYASFTLLNIRPSDSTQVSVWKNWLNYIKTYPSDRGSVNGHDRWVLAFQENLEDPKPLPMFITVHSRVDDPNVKVYTGKPIIFVPDQHIVVSIPAIPQP